MFKTGKPEDEDCAERMPTISECRTLAGPIREMLEELEEHASRAYERGRASSADNRLLGTLFARGATTSLLSIAAGLLEIAASRQGKQFSDDSFNAAARDCAEHVARRRLGKSKV